MRGRSWLGIAWLTETLGSHVHKMACLAPVSCLAQVFLECGGDKITVTRDAAYPAMAGTTVCTSTSISCKRATVFQHRRMEFEERAPIEGSSRPKALCLKFEPVVVKASLRASGLRVSPHFASHMPRAPNTFFRPHTRSINVFFNTQNELHDAKKGEE